ATRPHTRTLPHRHCPSPRLLLLETTRRGCPTAVERTSLCRIACTCPGRQTVSLRVEQRCRCHPATARLRHRRPGGPRTLLRETRLMLQITPHMKILVAVEPADFRLDLDAAGIPYAVDGPDGLLYADFHALRHSFI